MELQNAKGTKDIPPEEKIIKQKIVDTLKEVFELYGFNPLETPLLERYETISAKYAGGAEILKETFKLKDQGGRQLALRYDLTVPFSRFVGMNPNLKMPFKRYQIGRVFRDGPIKLGRYREFWQCDVDVVGAKSMKADAECLMIAKEAFKRLKLDVIITVNNRKILDSMLEYAGVPKGKRTTTILSIDKLKKFGEQSVKEELIEKGLEKESIAKIINLISIKGDNQEKIKALEVLENKEGLEEIKQVLSYVEVEFDPSLARGLAYYTGTIFEIFLKDSKIKSAITAGGRYDNMIPAFLETEKEYPAVGISFGLDVIKDAMKDETSKKTVTKLFIIPIGTFKQALEITQKLRSNGINTDIDLNDRGPSKNMKYANALKIPYVIFIGEEELKSKKFKLKDMNSGEEQELSIDEIITFLRWKSLRNWKFHKFSIINILGQTS